MRSKNEMILVNVAYKFTAALTAMAEYTHMTTDYLGRRATPPTTASSSP